MKSILALLSGVSVVSAAVRGFNYGSTGGTVSSFTAQFKTAANLAGGNNFNSARLYTMIQDGTTTTPISAIQAAIDTKTNLLLGLWASVDQAQFNNELTALKNAITQYGSSLAGLSIGISVGSEDLYRISPVGIANESGYGQSPDVLVKYIEQVRAAIKGTVLANVPVGHVDTWNVYVNSTNNPVIAACDWLGLDEYPYYQTTDSNAIDNGAFLFFQAYDRVSAVAGGKPIWITEAGWPTSGKNSNLAIASVSNAATFWQDVGCELERRNVNFWWYILSDVGATPSFGVSIDGAPLYNLTCAAKSTSTSSTRAASSTLATSRSGTSTGTASASTASTTGAGAVVGSNGSTGASTGVSTGASTGASTGGSRTSGSVASVGSATTTNPVATHTGAASAVVISRWMAGGAAFAVVAGLL